MCQEMPRASKLLKEITSGISHIFSLFFHHLCMENETSNGLTARKEITHFGGLWLQSTICFQTFLLIFLHSNFSPHLLTISNSHHCSKGWSQDQVIFSAAHAMALVRFRLVESSKLTIHVPRAFSPTKALKVSLGRVHE